MFQSYINVRCKSCENLKAVAYLIAWVFPGVFSGVLLPHLELKFLHIFLSLLTLIRALGIFINPDPDPDLKSEACITS